jgi:hypothetical protein
LQFVGHDKLAVAVPGFDAPAHPPCPQEHAVFDTVCLATVMHKLANLQGAPNLHAAIVQAPEFFKLKQLICEWRPAVFLGCASVRAAWTDDQQQKESWAWQTASRRSPLPDQLQPVDATCLPLPARPPDQRRSEFTARNLANTLWSLAKINHHPGAVQLSLSVLPQLRAGAERSGAAIDPSAHAPQSGWPTLCPGLDNC